MSKHINKSSSSPMISLDKVSIVFGNRPKKALPLMNEFNDRETIQKKTGQILGVHNCSLDINVGEIVVLMGLSGSGKSTLLRAINLLNKPIHGKVCINDGAQLTDISHLNEKELRFFRTQRIAMVFQQFALLPWRTVIDNVALGLEALGIEQYERKQRAMEQLKEVNLTGWENCQINELSGGMQQRVGLARALVTNAPILLMDEPFSALDPLIRLRLQDELLRLQKQLQRTIVFVTHDLDEALKLGSRIVIMEGGRIIQTGTPEEIIFSPKTQYVTEFVTQMNPLKTLRAHTIMRDITEEEKTIMNTATCVHANTFLFDVITTKQHHNTSIIFVKDNNTIIGCISDKEIIAALARQKHLTPQ